MEIRFPSVRYAQRKIVVFVKKNIVRRTFAQEFRSFDAISFFFFFESAVIVCSRNFDFYFHLRVFGLIVMSKFI